jgi:hypothetical protein
VLHLAALLLTLIPAGSTPARPFGDGVHLVFAATPQRIVSRDPHRHRARSFAFDGTCAVAGADTGAALVTCGDTSQQPYVLLLGSGRRVTVAGHDGQAVAGGVLREDFDDIGRQWLHAASSTEGCYHCEGEAFVNWHTGERRERATFPTPPPPLDLDDPDLRRLPRPPPVLARCAGACLDVTSYRDRVAWTQRRRARWTVRRALVPSGRVTTWTLPVQRCAAGDHPVAAFADGGLYVSGCHERNGGRRPLYHALRARPGGARGSGARTPRG